MTLKPPRGVDKTESIAKFMRYLIKRDISFWLVECDSETEFRHYHGVASFPDYTKVEDMEKRKSAFQRKVNRELGFCYPLQVVQNLRSVYKYIHGPSNKVLNEWLADQSKDYNVIIE